MQVENESPRVVTGHGFTLEFLLFDHEKHDVLTGDVLHGLSRGAVQLTDCPVILGVGVDAEFDCSVGGGQSGWPTGLS